MRRCLIWLPLLYCLALAAPAQAATGRVVKVLPHFLDLKGRHALSPSLYERDAYQAYLRQHPKEVSAMRFDVQCKTSGDFTGTLKLKVELRGIAQGGQLPHQLVLEQSIKPGGWLGNWTGITLTSEQYKTLGEVTAWRVTLWEGDRQLGSQQSFLW